MRIRLTIQRNSLPVTNILWNVPDTASSVAYTITRLLEDVNHIVPLESAQWGLEDYAVEVGGFECLHFSPVTQALKEDDHVSIRPLMTAEVRARTITGRFQISDGGQHLVDGVPFGRPYLRAPHRPPLYIPARKRQHTEEQDTEDNSEARILKEDFSVGAPNDELTQQQVPPYKRLRLQREAQEDVNEVKDRENNRRLSSSRHTHSKTVQFKQPIAEELGGINDSDIEDDEDDDNFSLEYQDEDTSSSDSDSTSNPGPDSDSDSDNLLSGSNLSNSGSDSDSDSSIDSDSNSDSDTSSPPDILSSKDGLEKPISLAKPLSPLRVSPGQGQRATKQRNSRRTRANRLRYLKEAGLLDKDATLADLRKYEEAKSGNSEDSVLAQPFSSASGKRKRLDSETVRGDVAGIESINELKKRKEELIAKLNDSPSGTAWVDEGASTSSPPKEALSSDSTCKTVNKDQSPKKILPTRRMRPDTSAISRILARQATQPAAKKATVKATDKESLEPENASEPDFWKSCINVSAFECWDEQYELSTPPFPFQQHWDPASKIMREKKYKGRKKGSKLNPGAETALSEDEGERITLNYDDASGDDENPDTVISAAIESQLLEDVAAAQEAHIPPLPEDVSVLPSLTRSNIKQGAVIACKFFAVNPITITPEISDYKTAVVKKEGDSGNGAGTIQLKIAARDLPQRKKKFDKHGKRIYDTCDAFLMEDEDERVGIWEGQFGELLEAKLLMGAE